MWNATASQNDTMKFFKIDVRTKLLYRSCSCIQNALPLPLPPPPHAESTHAQNPAETLRHGNLANAFLVFS